MDLYEIRKKLAIGIPLSELNLRVTYYSRVSTESEKQHKSLINQIDHFEEMILNINNWTYIKGYIDEGISGTNANKRKNFMKMINDARENKFDLIVTKEISRFSRNTLDSIKYTRQLLNYGVAVYFVNDNINTALPDSELRLTIMASMAQDEIRRLSERVKFGMNRSMKNGIVLGNNSLYGYRKVNDRFKVYEKEAIIVGKIFNLYVISNYSLSKISKYLNMKNIKSPCGKTWSITTLKRMITNPKYKGYYCGHKIEVVDYINKKVVNIPKEKWLVFKSNKIPNIIDEKIWNKANIKICKNINKLLKKRDIFSSKLYCKKCGKIFHRRKNCTASNEISWFCSTHLKCGKNSCNSPNIRESELMKIFDNIIMLMNIDYNEFGNYLNKIYYKYLKKKYNYLSHIKDTFLKEKVIEIIFDKIIVDRKNTDTFLDIYLKYNINKTNEIYEFKRGFNTSGTKRYFIKYLVNFFVVEND